MIPIPSFCANQLDPWFKLVLFRGARSLNITKLDALQQKSGHLHRFYCEIMDLDSSLSFDGMAEGKTALLAQLRALAEAYERFCIFAYREMVGFKLDQTLPYGLGVGFRHKSAERRAWGEYHERRLASASDFTKILPETMDTQSIATRAGEVFVTVMKTKEGQIGTGYGATPPEAQDSARRSAYRKRDYPQEVPKFMAPCESPLILPITPRKGAWLECVLIGFKEP